MTKWLWLPQIRPAARLRLYCLAHAGAGASAFAAWGGAAPQDLEIAAIQLPGRETRFAEQPIRRLAEAAEGIAETITTSDERPFAVFGHSLGGKLAIHVASRLENTSCRPVHLFVSAALFVPNRDWLHKLSDRQFARSVAERFGALPAEITDDPTIWSVFERPLRADLEASETDTIVPRRLTIPLTVISGIRDTVVSGDWSNWQVWSDKELNVELVDADHFSYRTRPKPYLDVIAKYLSPLRP